MKGRFIFIVDFDAKGRWGSGPEEVETAIDDERFKLEELVDDFIHTSQSHQNHLAYVSSSFAVRERRGKQLSDLTKMKLRRS